MKSSTKENSTSKELKPTLGRIVLYKEHGGVTFPAMITAVYEPIEGARGKKLERVSLAVLNTESIQFVKEVFRGDGIGEWEWLPYTLEVNKKENAKEEKNSKK